MPLAVTVFVSLCGLLVAGKFVRLRIPLLQRLYLPSSVIGGVIGLAVMTAFGDRIDPEEKKEKMEISSIYFTYEQLNN